MASKEKYATDDDFHMEVKIQNEERDHKKHEEIKLMNNVVSVKKNYCVKILHVQCDEGFCVEDKWL